MVFWGDDILTWIGLVTLLYGLVFIMYTLFQLLYGKLLMMFNGLNLVKKYGKWAIITGSTDGIGEALAFELGGQGMHLVLISRNDIKLQDTKKRILLLHPFCQVRTLVIDFSSFDSEARVKVADVITDIPIGILINNVGVAYENMKLFHEACDEVLERILSVNLTSAIHMTNIVLPNMKSNKKGLVVNTSSGSAHCPFPYMSAYSSVKAAIEGVSTSMSEELVPYGIQIQCHLPLFVVSKMTKLTRSYPFVPTSAEYASWAVSNLGNSSQSSPYLLHSFQWLLLFFIPSPIVGKVKNDCIYYFVVFLIKYCTSFCKFLFRGMNVVILKSQLNSKKTLETSYLNFVYFFSGPFNGCFSCAEAFLFIRY